MNEMNALDFFKDLIKIPSLSGNEAEIAEYLTEFLRSQDFEILPSPLGNVIGRKGQGSPVLLLVSHMDTVSTENPFREDDHHFYGTGVVDCKASLASMFYSAATFPWTDNLGTIIVTGLVHEEDNTMGLVELLANPAIQPDYTIFGEPTEIDKLCLGFRGRVWLKLFLTTNSVQTSCAWESDNAIEVVYDVYRLIKGIELNHNIGIPQTDPHFHEISVILSTFHAGIDANILPRDCAADIDIRIPHDVEADDIISQIDDIIQIYQQEHQLKDGTQIRYEVVTKYNAVEVPSSAPIVNALRWAIFQTTKEKVEMIKRTGSSFTNMIQAHYGKTNLNFACITYGPGDPTLEHTDNEGITKKEYLQSIKIYQKFFLKLAEFHASAGN